MQVLSLLRYELPRAIATDWKQFVCGLRGHDAQKCGTSYGMAHRHPDDDKLWIVGPPVFYHYRCKKCHKSWAEPCKS